MYTVKIRPYSHKIFHSLMILMSLVHFRPVLAGQDIQTVRTKTCFDMC